MKMLSIIIPTFNNAENLQDILISVETQSYPAKEIIVIDDNSKLKAQDKGATRIVVEEAKKQFKTNILYLDTNSTDYALAKARNMGVIESMGDVLVFIDDRLKLIEGSLEKIAQSQGEFWFFGKKQCKGQVSAKISFVENFSWIDKRLFRRFGCFNERINLYGAMSQDIRERWEGMGGKFKQCEVYAEEIKKSGSRMKKDQVWKAKLLLYKLNG